MSHFWQGIGAALTSKDFSLFYAGAFLLMLVLAFWFADRIKKLRKPSELAASFSMFRFAQNPILGPIVGSSWQNEAVFNPAAVVEGGLVHLFYRALGSDGVSRIGYASSKDGYHFDRAPEPVFVPAVTNRPYGNPFARYNRDKHASGGGWAGAEDPRAVRIGNRVYVSFSLFESWSSIRMGITSIAKGDLLAGKWKWARHLTISPAGETNKNWVLFPEKIRGKFAIIHALTPNMMIEYVDTLEELEQKPIKSNNRRSGRTGKWDTFIRGVAAPPIRTRLGWLLFYHAMDAAEPHIGYKVGAMILDAENPEKILYRSAGPVLSPIMPYENDWKPGVVYASGAVVKDGTLFLYYGGGDKTVCVASAPLDTFLKRLSSREHIELSPASASL